MLPHSLASEPPQGWSVWKVFAWAAETTFSWIPSVLISPNGKKERKKRSVSPKELISSFLWRKRQTVMSKQRARWFKQLSSGLQGKTQQFPVLLLLCLKGKKGKQNKELLPAMQELMWGLKSLQQTPIVRKSHICSSPPSVQVNLESRWHSSFHRPVSWGGCGSGPGSQHSPGHKIA